MTDPAPHTPVVPAKGILLICRDLMLASGIHAAARESGVPVKQLPSFKPENFVAKDAATGVVSPLQFALCIVDLSVPALPVQEIADWCKDHGLPVMGFGSHVATEALNAARAAGFAQVIPNSQLSRTIPSWLELAR